MRLIWKKYDSEFNPILMVVGAAFLVGGVSVLAQIAHALGDPVVWVFAAVPLIAALIGVITLVREYQLWKPRELCCSRGCPNENAAGLFICCLSPRRPF